MRKLQFADVSKDRLFFDQYEYSICFSIPEAGVLRAKTPQEFTKNIQHRNNARYTWTNRILIQGTVLDNLVLAFGKLDQIRDKVKIVISFDIVHLYSNDTKILQDFSELPYVCFCNANRAVVDRPRDIIFKTNPKFKYRSYFKDRSLTVPERDRLLDFIETRKESYWVTQHFKDSLSRYAYQWLQRHQFVEHNDPKDITMLSLACPGLIRKTLAIQAK